VAIAVADDAEWQRLCQALGWPHWAMDSRYHTLSGRLEHQDEIDRGLAEWTRQRTPQEAAQYLQDHQVTAGPVLSVAAAYQDPQLRDRGFFETLTHPEAGTHEYPGILWKMSHTPAHLRTHPCCLGEHNGYVYGTLLGYTAEVIQSLTEAGHIGDTSVEAQE
jgi:crotonobetainyl-CoA:carnitine CoA-transferase CaiB-like acyl-CoA transferase